jgi:hypothetical protein
LLKIGRARGIKREVEEAGDGCQRPTVTWGHMESNGRATRGTDVAALLVTTTGRCPVR